MPTTTHFGFRTIDENEKSSLVRGVFDSVASRYDLMNDLMSGGLHRLWKNDMVAWLNPRDGMKVLDVAGGTGDIAFRILKHAKKIPPPLGGRSGGGQSCTTKQVSPHPNPPPNGEGIKVVVCDINRHMLEEGRNRAIDRNILPPLPPGEGRGEELSLASDMLKLPHPHPHPNPLPQGEGTIHWVCGNAESLPLPDCSYDAYTIAFGIRNVTHIDAALKEAYRVLKPGGRFLCLEFSHLARDWMQKAYDAYSFHIIPKIGQAVTGSGEPYQYLVESIRQFPKQDVFAAMMRTAGFGNVQYRNLTQGIVAIHSGRKL